MTSTRRWRSRLTTYELKIDDRARREWDRLDSSVRNQFKKKLAALLVNPHVPSMRMRGFKDSYRIKLRKAGYRLAYRVFDRQLIVFVVAIGKRDKSEVFEDFALRYNPGDL